MENYAFFEQKFNLNFQSDNNFKNDQIQINSKIPPFFEAAK